MIRLPNTGTYSLELVTAQNGASVTVCYSDATTNTYPGNIQVTSVTSATTTTICSTPAASTVRDIDFINIKNTFAGSHTMSLQIDANGTNYPMFSVVLLTDESLNFTHGSGWQCKDANGNTKTTPLTAMTSAQLAAIVSDETGSGALVFATSPTLVTPALGTPASGDLRNCSMAVAPAIGGTTPNTGAFTVLSATGNTVTFGGSGAAMGDHTILISRNRDDLAPNAAIGNITYRAGTANNEVVKMQALVSGTSEDGGYYIISTRASGGALTENTRFLAGGGISVTGVISGTSIQNTPIGSTTASTGAFTTLSATGNVMLGDATTDTVTVNGYMTIGGTASSITALAITSAALTGVSQYGAMIRPIFTSAATTSGTGVLGACYTADGSYTVANLYQFQASQQTKGAGVTITNQHGVLVGDQTQGANNYGITNLVSAGANKWGYYGSGAANNAFVGSVRIGSTVSPTVALDVTGAILAANSILSSGATQGIGYTTGSGGTVTQITSRTTGVIINKVNGEITLVSAAGSASWQSMTVTNSAMADTDHVVPTQKSGTDKYLIHVTAKAAGSFELTYATTGGTTTEQPVFGFEIHKGTAA